MDFSNEILNFGSWGIGQLSVGILPILLVYYLIFRYPIPLEQQRAQLAGYAVLGIQILGYYAAFLITPYELEWHLSFSITRLTVQVFPLLLFLVLNAGTTVEAAFQTNAGGINGVNHASRR